VIIIFGSNATFDAGQKGRFFSGDGSKGKTSLELHGITLQNGKVDEHVSKHLMYIHFRISDAENCMFLCHFWEFSPLPNGLYVLAAAHMDYLERLTWTIIKPGAVGKSGS
jgi:hypothetical protein